MGTDELGSEDGSEVGRELLGSDDEGLLLLGFDDGSELLGHADGLLLLGVADDGEVDGDEVGLGDEQATSRSLSNSTSLLPLSSRSERTCVSGPKIASLAYNEVKTPLTSLR